jgi:ATP-dependent helicase/nuclease subunit A
VSAPRDILKEPSVVAADPKHSAWVAANAGAGKTYTLANRVTRLLLAGTAPEKILCLTYTKAAAAEMQGRLFKQLGEWAMLPNKALESKVMEIGAELGGPEDMKTARRLFAKALETPGGLKILTIHAFCQNVLSRFPLEAGVPASFDVLDEQTTRELIAEARTRVLERSGSGDAVRASALAFLLTQTSEATLNDILNAALGGDRRKLDRFFEKLGAQQTMPDAVWQAHGADPSRRADTIVSEFCNSVLANAEEVRSIAEWMRGSSNKTDRESAAVLLNVLAMAPGRAMFAAYAGVLLKDDRGPRKDPVTRTHGAKRPDLRDKVVSWQNALLKTDEQRKAAHAAALTEAALTVADAVRSEYAGIKEARGALDYDDLIVRTQQLFENGDAASWVLYKLDGGIEHILIDEAQDTSPEQWRIVKALTAEFFAGEGASGDAARTVFAVGDEKQSIFSFQGADPTQFAANRTAFADAARRARRGFVDQPLLQSRRSVPEVLRFVDAVFAPEDARAGLTFGGGEIRHEAFRAADRGSVELWPAVKPTQDPDDDPYDLPPVDYVSSTSPVAQLARRLAGEIIRMIGRVTLPGHTEPVKAGDIMILLPRREPFGSAIIRELKQRGVAVAGADRILLTDQIAVMDLISLGRFALLPEDDLTLATVLRSPLCSVSEDELFRLSHGRAGTLWRELEVRKDEAPSFRQAHDFLSEMRARADFAPPYEFYAHAVTARGMRVRLLKRLGHDAMDPIDEFLSLCFAYEAANTPSLEGFLHWIECGGAEIKRDMERGRDEVRVMTVHGAKGLEADIVILPDTASPPSLSNNRGSMIYTDEGVFYLLAKDEAPQAVARAKAEATQVMMEEYRRLLYVALTRARDRLILCGFETKTGMRPGVWYKLAERAAKELGVEVEREGGQVRLFGDALDTISVRPLPTEAKKPKQLGLWLRTPAPKDPPTPKLIRPFDAAGIDGPATFSPFAENRRFRRGIVVHALLAHLPEVEPGRRAALARQFLRVQNITGDEADKLIRETLAVMDDPVFAAAFTPESRAEVPIVADLGELGRVNGRIDRLAITADSALIVDFKTNRPPPKTEGEVAPLYRTQMALYRAAAERIFPGRRIACGLIWTDGPVLMPLSDSLLDAEMGQIRTRLDPHVGRS